MELEIIMFNKISQTQEDKCCILSLIQKKNLDIQKMYK